MGARVIGLSMYDTYWNPLTWLSGDVALLAGLPELRKIDLSGTAAFGSDEVRKLPPFGCLLLTLSRLQPLRALTHLTEFNGEQL